MAKGIYRLTVRDEFAAAHALRHYQGKCENIHGHNYGVELVVEGETLSGDVEILADFGDLKKALKAALADLDHRLLNDVPPFDRLNPSSENLARHLYKRLEGPVTALKARVHSVTVSERGAQSATYLEVLEPWGP